MASQNSSHFTLEQFLNVVEQQGGVLTDLPAVINSSLTVNGSINGQSNVSSVTADETLTTADSGSTLLLDAAAGATVTLPAPAAGLTYTFVVLTTVTSNSYKVVTDASTTFLQGYLAVPVAAGTSTYFFADGTSDISINLNGSTTGGLLGGQFSVTCLDGTQWQVSGVVEGSGTVATPFAT